MLNIAICDDDSEFLNNLLPIIKEVFINLKTPASIHLYTDGNKLISNFEKYNPYYNIIFLDIEMPTINGKEVAKKLRILDKKFKLIFITSYENEVLNTFQYDVIGFLPKFLIHKKITNIIALAIKKIYDDNPHFQIFKVNLLNETIKIKIPLDDIMYFESVNRKIYLYSRRETYNLQGYQFSKICTDFIPLGFMDIHRTCIVNIKYIYSIEKTKIGLENGITLPMSRHKRQEVLNKFSEIVSAVM